MLLTHCMYLSDLKVQDCGSGFGTQLLRVGTACEVCVHIIVYHVMMPHPVTLISLLTRPVHPHNLINFLIKTQSIKPNNKSKAGPTKTDVWVLLVAAMNQLVSMWGNIGLGTSSHEASSVASTSQVSPTLLSRQGGNIRKYLDCVGLHDRHDEFGALLRCE